MKKKNKQPSIQFRIKDIFMMKIWIRWRTEPDLIIDYESTIAQVIGSTFSSFSVMPIVTRDPGVRIFECHFSSSISCWLDNSTVNYVSIFCEGFMFSTLQPLHWHRTEFKDLSLRPFPSRKKIFSDSTIITGVIITYTPTCVTNVTNLNA